MVTKDMATGLIIQNLHHNFLYKPQLIQQTGLHHLVKVYGTCCVLLWVGKSCFLDSLANTQSCYSLHMGYGIITWIIILLNLTLIIDITWKTLSRIFITIVTITVFFVNYNTIIIFSMYTVIIIAATSWFRWWQSIITINSNQLRL